MRHRATVALLFAGLWASQLSAQIPAGGEFQINSFTSGYQKKPSVTVDAAGNFVVVWTSLGQDGYSYGVFGQRYTASGARRGSEFQVNTYTTGWQRMPSVASDAAGNFVVVWEGNGNGDYFGVFAQRYDADGVRRGSAFQVNTSTTYGQRLPQVASDPSGDFVVVWQGPGDGDIFAQRYDASGARQGGEFRVNTQSADKQWYPAVASDASGNFVVVWMSYGQDGSYWGVFGQRYGGSGLPRGAEFRVNTYTTSDQWGPSVASDPAGDFIVAWDSQDGDGYGVFAQRYDASGVPRGAEFRVNTYTTERQGAASAAMDDAGNFVVTWASIGQDGSSHGVFGQRYDESGAPRGAEFRVNTYTPGAQWEPSTVSDAAGNFVVAWTSYFQDGDLTGVVGQRFGGLTPAAVTVDASASSGSDGNGVLEPGETTVAVAPSWRNVNGATRTFDGIGLSFNGPPASGVSYELADAAGSYGTVADGATAACSDCYQVGVAFGGTRPATHWDATFTERLTPDAMGQTKPWSLHIGESFTDVPKTSGYYRFVETLLHRKVTAGCSATAYCPTSAVTREQMSVFTLAGKEGAGYLPAACTTPIFGDVPASSPFCRFIEELARRGVVSGCGGGNYCPANPVTREQISVFLLHTLDPALNPPACTTPVFPDVPASSPFCRWIEELARRGVTSGCGGGNYCPADPVTREQMAVFISATFGLSLYGP
jgi:hypothetical protein